MSQPSSLPGHDLSRSNQPGLRVGLVVEKAADVVGLDLVAVHGLHLAADNPWRDLGPEKPSLRDVFQTWTGAGVRLMTYNYYPRNLTLWKIHREAGKLLEALQALRSKESNSGSDPGKSRPIIFVSQDIGGLIVKAAMIQAMSAPQKFASIITSVRGLIFVGSPHRYDRYRPLEDQLAILLQGADPPGVHVGTSARSLAKTVERINGDFVRSRILLSVVLVTIFSTHSNPRDQVFYEYTATMEVPFERRVASGNAHAKLAAVLLDKEDPSYSSLMDTAGRVWTIELHDTKTIESLYRLVELASPVYPLEGLSDAVNAAVASQFQDVKAFIDVADSRILHVRGKTELQTSLLTKSLVRYLRTNASQDEFIFPFEFRYGDVRFNNARTMIANFLAQLFCNELYERPLYAKVILNVPEEYSGWTLEDMLVMWRRYRSGGTLNNVIYVLGSFDQCDASAHVFLDLLVFIARETELPVKVVITSTVGTDKHIEEAFSSCRDQPVYVRRDIPVENSPSSAANTDQLDLLLQDQPRLCGLEPSLLRLVPCYAEDEKLFRVVIDWLRQTDLALHCIEAMVDRLEPANPEAVLEILLNLIPEERQLWSRRLLSWVSASARPLTVTELCTVSHIAVALPEDFDIHELGNLGFITEPDALGDILKRLGGILTVRDDEAQFGHPSFRGALQARLSGYEMQQHLDILEICLAFLGQPRNLTSPDGSREAEQADQQDQGFGMVDIRNSLPYAVEYWSRHYKIAIAASQPPTLARMDRIRSQVRHLLGEASFLAYWGVVCSDSSGRFIPKPPTQRRRSSLSVVSQLGLDDLVRELLPSSNDQELEDGLIEAARNGHLGAIIVFLGDGEKRTRFDWPTLVEATTKAATSGNNEVFNLLIKHVSGAQIARPPILPPPAMLFRASWLGLHTVVDALLDLGADPTVVAPVNQFTPLHAAVVMDRATTLEVLIRRGSDLAARSQIYEEIPLQTACNYGSRKSAEILINAGVPTTDSKESNSPLRLAVYRGNFKLAEILLKHDRLRGRTSQDPTGMDEEYTEALCEAAKWGYRRCADILLRHGADPNRMGDSGLLPLQQAIWNHDADLCRLLLDHNANANDTGKSLAPLVIASEQGDGEIVSLLLEKGALVDATYGSSGRTSLHVAATAGNDGIIQTLLTAKAKIDARDEDDYTPLWLAARHDHASTVDILAGAGADVNALSSWSNWAPLHVSYDLPDVTRVLLKHGAAVNQPFTSGTALSLAASYGCVEVVKLLLEKGASLTAGSSFASPFAAAVQAEEPETAKVLLEAGDDVDQPIGPSDDPKHAMHYAVAIDSSAMVELIQEFSPKPDAWTKQGDSSVLHNISKVTPVRSVQRLIRAGVDPNLEDSMGHTALCNAILRSNIDVARFLIQSTLVRRRGISGHGADLGGLVHHAVRNSTVEMVKLLVEAGEDVNERSAVYGGLISASCIPEDNEVDDQERMKIICYLSREVGVDVKTEGGVMGYAINAAAATCGPEVVELLLSEGAAFHVVDAIGRTPFHLACRNNLATLKALPASDEDFRVRDRLGQLPLHYAALCGRAELMREVLEGSRRVGISIDEPDRHGWTPLLWAARATIVWPWAPQRPTVDHASVIALLLAEGANPMASGDADGGKWTATDIAVLHGADRSLLKLLRAARTAPQRHPRRRGGHGRRVGEKQDRFCDACLVMIVGYYHNCATCRLIDLCFKCYLGKEDIHPGHSWTRRGEESDLSNSVEDALKDSDRNGSDSERRYYSSADEDDDAASAVSQPDVVIEEID